MKPKALQHWHTAKLSELFEFKNGVNAEKKAYGSGVPFINVMEVIGNPALSAAKIPGRVTLSPNIVAKNLVHRGDVLFNRTSEIEDEIAFSSVYLDDEPVIFGGFVIRGRPKNGKLLDGYKKYCFRSQAFRSSLIRAGQGAVRSNIGQKDLDKISLTFPDHNEQKRIVTVLERWDEAIEKLEKKILFKKKIRKSIVQKLTTGKLRLLNFNKPWKFVNFSEVLKEHKAKSSGREEVHSVSVHKGVVNQIEHLGRSFSAATTDHYNLVKPGDVIYTKSPTGEFPLGIIKQSKLSKDVIVSPLYGVFTPETYDLGVILNAYFESPINTRNYLNPIVRKGAKNTINITNKTFLSNGLVLPRDKEEQREIAQIITTAEREVFMLQKKLIDLKQQRIFLLNALISGHIPTPDNMSISKS